MQPEHVLTLDGGSLAIPFDAIAGLYLRNSASLSRQEVYHPNDNVEIVFSLFGGGLLGHRLPCVWEYRSCDGEWRATDVPRRFSCSDCGTTCYVPDGQPLVAVPHRNYRSDQSKEPLPTPPRLSPEDETLRQEALAVQREADLFAFNAAIQARVEEIVARIDNWQAKYRRTNAT